MVAGCNDEDSLVGSVSPIGEPATGELARRFLPANAFVELPAPKGRAAGRVNAKRSAPGGGDGEDAPLRVQRRSPVILAHRRRAGVVPRPSDRERVEGLRVDLRARREARSPRARAPV